MSRHTASLEILNCIVSRRLRPSNCENQRLIFAHFPREANSTEQTCSNSSRVRAHGPERRHLEGRRTWTARRSCSMPSKLRSTTRFFFDADDVGQTASIYTDSDGCRRHDCFLARARLGFGRRRFPRVTHTHTNTSQATTWSTWRATPGYAAGIDLGQYCLLLTMGSLCFQHTWKCCPCA